MLLSKLVMVTLADVCVLNQYHTDLGATGTQSSHLGATKTGTTDKGATVMMSHRVHDMMLTLWYASAHNWSTLLNVNLTIIAWYELVVSMVRWCYMWRVAD